MRILKWIKETIKNRDIFEKSISLTYKGNHSFKTLFGGIVSTIILILMILYGIMLFIQMVNRDNTNKSKNSIVIDPEEKAQYYHIGTNNLSFAIYLSQASDKTPFIDESYFNISITQLEYVLDDGTGDLVIKQTDMGASI